MQAVRALATAIWVADCPSEFSSQEQAEVNPEFWLDRARGYAARVGCLMAVA